MWRNLPNTGRTNAAGWIFSSGEGILCGIFQYFILTMAALDNLIETLNANNFFVPVSVCVVVSAVLLFTVIKWLSKTDKRDKAVSFDVDDLDKEIQGSLKKTKQRKVCPIISFSSFI